MTTSFRRESVPRHSSVERIVVGPTPYTAITGPSEPTRTQAAIRYVFPDAGAASLGTAACPDGVREAVEHGIEQRRPDAIWFRDLPWFTALWGVRAAGHVERLLSETVAGTDIEFVSWLEAADWLRMDHQRGRQPPGGTQMAYRMSRPTVRSR